MEDKNAAHRAMALYLYAVGLSMNAIARMVGVEPSAVLYWIGNFALRVHEKPTPQGAVVIELDEMWHFLGSKKRSLAVEGLLPHYRSARRLGVRGPERRKLGENA
jgi:hypothetical protein